MMFKQQLIKGCFAVAIGTFLFAGNAYAFSHSNIPGLGGGSPAAPKVDVDGMINTSNGLVRRFVASLNSLNTAQSYLVKAFKIKDKRDLSAEEKTALESGNVMDKEGLQRAVAATQANQAEIDKKIAEGAVLDAKGKVELAKAVPHQTKGTVNAVLLVPEYIKLSSSISSGLSGLSSNPMGALKLKDGVSSGLWVTSKLPSLANALRENSNKLTSYSEKAGIDVKDSKSALAGMPEPK
jgi:hypothetical protein